MGIGAGTGAVPLGDRGAGKRGYAKTLIVVKIFRNFSKFLKIVFVTFSGSLVKIKGPGRSRKLREAVSIDLALVRPKSDRV